MADFPRLDRRALAGGCPADAFAEARLRAQEYWIAARGARISWPRPRQDQARYASYAWRALWTGWLPLRQGLKKLTAKLDMNVLYEGSGGAPDLQVRLTIQGVATASATATTGTGVRLIELELDAPLDVSLPSAWVTLEFRSEVSNIKEMLVGGSTLVTGTWTRYGEMTAITASAPMPTPTSADRVLVALEDGQAAEVIEVTGPDSQINSPTQHRWPVASVGTDSQHTLAVGWLTYFELRALELLAEYEVLGAASAMIAYAPQLIRSRIPLRGEVVSLHEHNSTGLYERAPQWRLIGSSGTLVSDGEITRRSRWTLLHVQHNGIKQDASCTRTIELNREAATVRLTLGLLGVFLPQPGRPRNRTIPQLIQGVTLELIFRQFIDSTSPTTLQSETVELRLPFLNPVLPDAPDLLHQLGQTLRAAEVFLTPNVNWREGIATLDDLAQSDLITVDLAGIGLDPRYPLEVEVKANLDNPISSGGDPLDAWIVVTSYALTCYGGVFNGGSPSSANKRLARRYFGPQPLETGIGRGVDSEDWSRWPDLNHLTWSQIGWVSEGIVGPLVITSASFVQPEEIARWRAIFEPQRELSGSWKLRVQMFALEIEVRISVTDLSNATTTYLLSNGSTPQWVEQVITLSEADRQIITLDIRTTSTEGTLYALSAREPQAAEGDL